MEPLWYNKKFIYTKNDIFSNPTLSETSTELIQQLSSINNCTIEFTDYPQSANLLYELFFSLLEDELASQNDFPYCDSNYFSSLYNVLFRNCLLLCLHTYCEHFNETNSNLVNFSDMFYDESYMNLLKSTQNPDTEFRFQLRKQTVDLPIENNQYVKRHEYALPTTVKKEFPTKQINAYRKKSKQFFLDYPFLLDIVDLYLIPYNTNKNSDNTSKAIGPIRTYEKLKEFETKPGHLAISICDANWLSKIINFKEPTPSFDWWKKKTVLRNNFFSFLYEHTSSYDSISTSSQLLDAFRLDKAFYVNYLSHIARIILEKQESDYSTEALSEVNKIFHLSLANYARKNHHYSSANYDTIFCPDVESSRCSLQYQFSPVDWYWNLYYLTPGSNVSTPPNIDLIETAFCNVSKLFFAIVFHHINEEHFVPMMVSTLNLIDKCSLIMTTKLFKDGIVNTNTRGCIELKKPNKNNISSCNFPKDISAEYPINSYNYYQLLSSIIFYNKENEMEAPHSFVQLKKHKQTALQNELCDVLTLILNKSFDSCK